MDQQKRNTQNRTQTATQGHAWKLETNLEITSRDPRLPHKLTATRSLFTISSRCVMRSMFHAMHECSVRCKMAGRVAYQVELGRRRDHPVERVDGADHDRLIGDEGVELRAVVVQRVRGCDDGRR